jgi:RNA polymerase sigma-70 factor (ECF subfamily)
MLPRAAVRSEMGLSGDLSFRRSRGGAGENPTEEHEWSRLMAAAQSGDRAAYERLLREVTPFVRARVRSFHRSPDRAEDVVQDVLLTVHRVRHTYDPGRPFAHWLAAITRRRSIDALRRVSRIGAAETSDEIAYATFADPRPKKEEERREAGAGLAGAIAGLTANQREAVELLKLNEMSLAEASRQSGKSIAALKVNLHRAIKALRARLAGPER